jgi:hypothetical protein
MSRLRLQLTLVIGLAVVLVFAASAAEAGRGARAPIASKRKVEKTSGKRAGKSTRTRATRSGSKLARRVKSIRTQAKPTPPVSGAGKEKSAKRRPEVAFQQAVQSARKRGALILDVGGEGAHKGAVNVNPGTLTSTTGKPGRLIPNRVEGVTEKIPFPSGSAAVVIVENAPIRPGAAAELARVVGKGGTIKLTHPSDYAKQAHAQVVEATRGRALTETRNGITTTVIAVP